MNAGIPPAKEKYSRAKVKLMNTIMSEVSLNPKFAKEILPKMGPRHWPIPRKVVKMAEDMLFTRSWIVLS